MQSFAASTVRGVRKVLSESAKAAPQVNSDVRMNPPCVPLVAGEELVISDACYYARFVVASQGKKRNDIAVQLHNIARVYNIKTARWWVKPYASKR